MVAGRWPLPPDMRAAVPDYWARAIAANPHLWDGRILGLTSPDGGPVTVVDGVLRAEAREDAYSAFLTWRGEGFPEIGMCHAFGWALIVSGDGALLYGLMGGETANAGRIYPPGGSLEPRDARSDGTIDFLKQIEIELDEETGLDPAEAQAGMILAVLDGPRISVGRVYRFAEPADALRAKIVANFATQAHQELADIVIVRSLADAQAPNVQPYGTALAEAYFAGLLDGDGSTPVR